MNSIVNFMKKISYICNYKRALIITQENLTPNAIVHKYNLKSKNFSFKLCDTNLTKKIIEVFMAI